MNILVLQETDWLTRGPHIQHHLFEQLSRRSSFNITVIDYDIDKIQRSDSLLRGKRIFQHVDRTLENSNVKIIRTAHLQVPYLRRFSSLITNFLEILKIIKKKRPDFIIGYSITNGLIGLIVSKLFHIPYVFHYIDILHKLVPIPYMQNLSRVSSRILLKYSDTVIVLTKFQRKSVINEGALAENVKILPNGISLRNISINNEKLEKLKRKFSISNNDFVIFFMGYLYEFSGLKEIIEYYNDDVKNKNLNLKFLIVGDGGIYNELVNYVKKIDSNWVTLTGKISFFDISEYIQLADLCLLSFDINDITREIVPIKIFEYMAMKKPVLSTSLPGIIYEIGKNHGVIYVKNQNDLIRKIGEISQHKEKLAKIGFEGFKFVKNNYEWAKIVDLFIQIIIELLKKKKT